MCGSTWKGKEPSNYCLWKMTSSPSSWDLSMPAGQQPASTLVLPAALPRSWVLFLLTLLNSKGIPEIIPVLPDVSSSVFYTQSLIVSPFYFPKIISSMRTLKNVLTEFNYVLDCDCQMTGHKKGTSKLGRGVEGYLYKMTLVFCCMGRDLDGGEERI